MVKSGMLEAEKHVVGPTEAGRGLLPYYLSLAGTGVVFYNIHNQTLLSLARWT